MIPCAWDVVVPSELCSDWDGYSQPIKDASLWLASTFLWARTGRQYGPCPITVRPAQDHFEDPGYRVYPVQLSGSPSIGGPYLMGGVWRNCGCGKGCCCRPRCAIALRGPVNGIVEVMVDGSEVPDTAYRVDVTQGTYWLVRLDGTCWPTCQDFQADEDDGFSVTYEIGLELPEALAIATALLACEYGKSLTGGNCRLPARMTSLNRQGVTVEVEPARPDEGLTGIREVDDVVAALNPGKRAYPPMILSPDLPEMCDRRTVINVGGS